MPAFSSRLTRYRTTASDIPTFLPNRENAILASLSSSCRMWKSDKSSFIVAKITPPERGFVYGCQTLVFRIVNLDDFELAARNLGHTILFLTQYLCVTPVQPQAIRRHFLNQKHACSLIVIPPNACVPELKNGVFESGNLKRTRQMSFQTEPFWKSSFRRYFQRVVDFKQAPHTCHPVIKNRWLLLKLVKPVFECHKPFRKTLSRPATWTGTGFINE